MSLTTERFNIETRMAVGCAGLVYRATERQNGFPVALKLLMGDEIGHPLDVPALLRDAQRLRMLSGAHVSQLLDVIQDTDGVVLVYQFIDGVSGAMLPTERRLEKEEAIDIAAQFLVALECAERTRQPHGDIKPSNIVVSKSGDGRPFLLVLDWGLSAYRMEPTPDSLLFLAPERLAGGLPSLRADFFAAGAVLHYLLSGQSPVCGADRDAVSAAWKMVNPGILKVERPDLPPKLVEWIAWLMELRPEKRPESVAAARHALDALHPPAPPPVPRHLIARPLVMRPQVSGITRISAPQSSRVLPPGVTMPHANLPQRVIPVFPPRPVPVAPEPPPVDKQTDGAEAEILPVEETVPTEDGVELPETFTAEETPPVAATQKAKRRAWHPAFSALLSIALGAAVAGGVWFYKRQPSVDVISESNLPAAPAVATGDAIVEYDIGNPAKQGGSNFDMKTGIWTVTGGGADIFDKADQFHFTGATCSGDSTVVACVTSLKATAAYSKAGVMIRESQAPGAMSASVVVTADAKPSVFHINFQCRHKPGQKTDYISTNAVPLPVWVKLTRTRNNISAFYSEDGTTWKPIGKPQVVPFTHPPLAGLCVTAHSDAAALCSATFTHTGILPPAWRSTDIGDTPPGVTLYNSLSKNWTVRAGGADIWETADHFHFTCIDRASERGAEALGSLERGHPGTQTFRLKVTSIAQTDPYAKAGIMFRASLAPDAAHVALVATPTGGVGLQWRASTGALCDQITVPGIKPPVLLQLERTGDIFTASFSTDGKIYQPLRDTKRPTVNPITLALPPALEIGYCVTSHTKAVMTTAVLGQQ